jgi:phage shock protein PspC (stress-responsive transcriptional regulator)
MADPTLSDTSPPLRRVRQGAMIAGVCGGLARWLGWDVTIVRLLYVIATVASIGFPGILTYLLLWVLMPRDEPSDVHRPTTSP